MRDVESFKTKNQKILQALGIEVHHYHPTASQLARLMVALIRRFHEAKQRDDAEVMVWGTGSPRREFLYVDDMAAASVHVMNLTTELWQSHVQPMCSHLNVGSGYDYTIREIAERIAGLVGYGGSIRFDRSKPDGSPRKLMHSIRLQQLGWHADVDLDQGLLLAYENFKQSMK